MKPRHALLPFLILLLHSAAFSFTFQIKGQVIVWLTANAKKTIKPQAGLRYIPTFSLGKTFENEHSLDFELSLNAYGTMQGNGFSGDIQPYRLWGRYATSRFEARIGLQKINFGSATLLRPLMWFDSIDPRDPLQLSDGVYGLLLRYYFLNNTNIWVWGLLGNDKPRGWEVLASSKKAPEFGGRVQVPLGNGETAATFHHRKIDTTGILQPFEPGTNSFSENKYALDGKWDIGVGIWFEAVLVHQETHSLPYPWQRALNVGLDYTFGLGNGLNVIGEHYVMTASPKVWSSGESVEFTAVALNYPLGLLDSVAGIFYYDWKNSDLYSFVRWQRTLDQWSFHVMAFWNPFRFAIYQAGQDNSLFSGKGIQLMIVYNY